MEKANDRMEKEIIAPLVSESNSQRAGNGVEDQTMVYFSTFVAVCGSYAFGSCVSSLTLSFEFDAPKFRALNDLSLTVCFVHLQAGFSSPIQSAITKDINLSIAEVS